MKNKYTNIYLSGRQTTRDNGRLSAANLLLTGCNSASASGPGQPNLQIPQTLSRSAAQPPDSQSAPYGSQLRTGLSIFHYLLNLTLTSFRDLWQVAARMCESAVLVLLYSLTLASVPFCVGVAKKEGLIPRCAEKFAKADN